MESSTIPQFSLPPPESKDDASIMEERSPIYTSNKGKWEEVSLSFITATPLSISLSGMHQFLPLQFASFLQFHPMFAFIFYLIQVSDIDCCQLE